LSENKVIKHYRLSSYPILQLLEEIKDDINSPTERSYSIPEVVKLLATLQLLASGSFQTVIASAVRGKEYRKRILEYTLDTSKSFIDRLLTSVLRLPIIPLQ